MRKAIFFEESAEHSWITYILKEMFIDRIYDRFLRDKKDAVVIDAGANIGLFTLYAYPYASKIYSIEPAKMHFDSMLEMLKYNSMEDKVETIQKALSTKDGRSTLFHTPNITTWALDWDKNKEMMASIGGVPKEKEEVETVTMSTLFTQYKIEHVDLLKLDIEGMEAELIGGKDFEEVCKNIDNIVFEWHAWNKISLMQVINDLKDYGYRVFPIEVSSNSSLGSDVTIFGATRNEEA